ncbi:hypothetical protein F4677DRAFT_348997 [Hypoxylon crocopeplum]|nr:hypothetical protein F4677DRAFT_348997 [Hypoxylon crocopeplum]
MMYLHLCHLLLPLSYALFAAGVEHGPEILSFDKRMQLSSSCADISAPTTFSLKQVSYLKFETYPGAYDEPPNSTQLAFEVVNQANGVSTGCSLQVVGWGGNWGDDSKVWHECIDRSLEVGGKEYPVKTSAHFVWDDWVLTVNQTWACDDKTTVRHISTATLEPDCTEDKTPFQYINSCTAPDAEVAATLQ